MPADREPNEQMLLWNGHAGQTWTDLQETLDRLFRPIESDLVSCSRSLSPKTVLDVGCGTGATTLAIARVLEPQSTCLGMDISEPMIALARRRARAAGLNARFITADAEHFALEPSSFDLVVSRFGVMFFADPVKAFANLRKSTVAGGQLQVYAWRSPAENPFMTAAERAAAPLLPAMPKRVPDAPGQFAFSNDTKVRDILEQSGWSNVQIRPVDYRLTLPLSELESYYTRMGSVGRILEQLEQSVRSQVLEAVRPAFDEFVEGDQVRFDAACWLITAAAV